MKRCVVYSETKNTSAPIAIAPRLAAAKPSACVANSAANARARTNSSVLLPCRQKLANVVISALPPAAAAAARTTPRRMRAGRRRRARSRARAADRAAAPPRPPAPRVGAGWAGPPARRHVLYGLARAEASGGEPLDDLELRLLPVALL